MKLFHYTLLLFCAILLVPTVAHAQHKKRVKRSNGLRFSFADSSVDSLEAASETKGFYYIGANYMSHVNTLGRDNNETQWSFDPIVGVHKYNTDLYINGFRWSATDPKWAETDIGISKQWQLNQSFGLVGTYEHAFVFYGSDDDKYGLNNLLSAQFVWSNPIAECTARYEYDWGNSVASILEFSIGHQFDVYDVFGKDKIEIEPRLYWTQLGGVTYPVRFFRDYTLNPEAFQVANYELELPFKWRKIGNVEASVSFILDIPQNVLAEEGTGKPLFFVTASVVKLFSLTK